MPTPFHAVARGLRLAHVGFLLACWGAVAAFGIGWVWDKTYYRDDELRLTLLVAMWAAMLAGVAGVVVGFIGRVRCLRMPEEFPAVRGRLLAAVVLEGSGWGSLFVGVGVMFAMVYALLTPHPWIPFVGIGLSGLMLLGGRIMFLRFMSKLAVVVEDAASARRARFSLTLFLTDWGLGLVGVGAAFGMSALGMYDGSKLVAIPIWISAGASGLYGLLLYDRLLGGLATSVRAFADASTADEEEDG
jgi:hypothetical protein